MQTVKEVRVIEKHSVTVLSRLSAKKKLKREDGKWL
jgi:hypothetical protein